mmetsp:Transcript_18407/g.63461  ORF Transcript_18407/g.63461 Transcript_18407/m.63461 type:complete len:257 (+) Transcript_18407:25-795(+)
MSLKSCHSVLVHRDGGAPGGDVAVVVAVVVVVDESPLRRRGSPGRRLRHRQVDARAGAVVVQRGRRRRDHVGPRYRRAGRLRSPDRRLAEAHGLEARGRAARARQVSIARKRVVRLRDEDAHAAVGGVAPRGEDALLPRDDGAVGADLGAVGDADPPTVVRARHDAVLDGERRVASFAEQFAHVVAPRVQRKVAALGSAERDGAPRLARESDTRPFEGEPLARPAHLLKRLVAGHRRARAARLGAQNTSGARGLRC